METVFKYNDPEFDQEHYPITQKHLDAVKKVFEALEINPPECRYQATIHGRVFWLDQSESVPRQRLDKELMHDLTLIDGFRWIELTDHEIRIGIGHTI